MLGPMRRPDIDELRGAFGGRDAADIIAAFCARGDGVIAGLFSALLAPGAGPSPAGRDGRAVLEDEALCLLRLASLYPETFLAQVRADPAIVDRLGVLDALAQVPGAAAESLLLAGLKHRRGAHRWLALRGLLARGCAAVSPHLPRLLRDRDSTVGFLALDGLRRWGRTADVPALLEYRARAAPGGVEFALDAIETICAREGQPLPGEHPGPRLELVTARGARVRLCVIVASRVAMGELLGHVDDAPLRSPCAGVVSAIELMEDRLQIAIRHG